jgi:hypothetical protein
VEVVEVEGADCGCGGSRAPRRGNFLVGLRAKWASGGFSLGLSLPYYTIDYPFRYLIHHHHNVMNIRTLALVITIPS